MASMAETPLSTVIISFISFILKIIGVVLSYEILWFLLVDVVISLSLFISYLNAYNKLYFKLKLIIDLNVLKKLLNDSWPLLLSSSVIMLYMKIDQLMIEKLIGIRELGKYALSVKIAESWYFIPMMVAVVLFPYMAENKIPERETRRRFCRVSFMNFWLALIISSLLYFTGEHIIKFVYKFLIVS